MTSKCWKSVGACAARVTKLGSCGQLPAPGALCSVAVTDSFTQISYTANKTTPTAVSLNNACGKLCVTDDSQCDSINWYDIAITFCGVEPELLGLITGLPLAMNHGGDAVGIGLADLDCTTQFSLEAWTKIPQDQCDVGVTFEAGYFLAPRVQATGLGDFTLQEGAYTFTVTGKAKKGSPWGVGPYNVDTGAASAPAPLTTAIGATEYIRKQLVTQPPPTPTCGCAAFPS